MDHFREEIQQIKNVLKNSSQGMTITEIARAIGRNKHSVGRYLDNLLVSGQVDMRTFGKAKVFTLSTRIPLNMMMGFADDLLLVLDHDNRIVRVNNQVLSFFKKTRNDFIGKNIQFLTFPEHWINQVFEKVRTSLMNKTSGDEIIISLKETMIFRQKNIPSVFEDGKKGMTVLLEDITAKKQAESALRSSEERFRLMAENIRDGIVITEDKKIVYMNKRAEDIFGCSRDGLTSINPIDFAVPEEKERIRKIIDNAIKNGIPPSDIQFWIQRSDGTQRYILNRITSLHRNSRTTYYVIVTDMTEWKTAHDALQNQFDFLQHMINTFPNPLFYLDTSGRFLGCNSAFGRMIGKTSEEIAGRNSDEFLENGSAFVFGEHHDELNSQNNVITYSGQYITPEGSSRRVTIQKSMLVLSDGRPAGIVGLVMSVNP